MGCKSPVQECSQAGSHNGYQFGPSTRPRQLRDREVLWEGSHRSTLMSRRTERPYKVDGTGELAPHSATQCSVPEINGPVVQQESSRPYSGRPVTRACRQRWDWPSAMALRREQESAEAIVPGATSRKTTP